MARDAPTPVAQSPPKVRAALIRHHHGKPREPTRKLTCQIVLKQRRNPFDSEVEGRNSGKNGAAEGESLTRHLLAVQVSVADYAFTLKERRRC